MVVLRRLCQDAEYSGSARIDGQWIGVIAYDSCGEAFGVVVEDPLGDLYLEVDRSREVGLCRPS